jgi:hypothetical protein
MTSLERPRVLHSRLPILPKVPNIVDLFGKKCRRYWASPCIALNLSVQEMLTPGVTSWSRVIMRLIIAIEDP